jgi:hypothetical protein
MLMLTLIGLLVAAAALYRFILWFNSYTRTHAHYEFFTMDHSLAMVFSYALIFFGHNWIQNGNDGLNGVIVMGIGTLILLLVMINNFIKAPKLYAIAGSLMQLILYIPIAIGAVIVVAVVLAWASETKPVYVINND